MKSATTTNGNPRNLPARQAQGDGQRTITARPTGVGAGGIQLTNVAQMFRFSDYVFNSGLVDKRTWPSPEAVFVAVETGLELGFKPMMALRTMYVVRQKPAIMGNGALALVRSSGKCAYVRSKEVGTPDTDSYGWEVRGLRKGDSPEDEVVRTFTIGDAKRAKLWGKTGRDGEPTPWTTNPGRMLYWRAVGFLLNDLFSDVLMGLIPAEAMDGYGEPDAVEVGGPAAATEVVEGSVARGATASDAAAQPPAKKPRRSRAQAMADSIKGQAQADAAIASGTGPDAAVEAAAGGEGEDEGEVDPDDDGEGGAAAGEASDDDTTEAEWTTGEEGAFVDAEPPPADDEGATGGEVYCHACSVAGGADRAIHHSPPACPAPPAGEAALEAAKSKGVTTADKLPASDPKGRKAAAAVVAPAAPGKPGSTISGDPVVEAAGKITTWAEFDAAMKSWCKANKVPLTKLNAGFNAWRGRNAMLTVKPEGLPVAKLRDFYKAAAKGRLNWQTGEVAPPPEPTT